MRFSGPGQAYEGLVHMVNGHPTWTGKVTTHDELLLAPIRWQKPHRIFVNSMSDLFHESVPFEFIAKVFAVMACTRRHTYQILTKRPERMLAFFKWLDDFNEERGFGLPADWWPEAIDPAEVYPEWKPWREGGKGGGYDCCGPNWPLDNVWLGVSAENQPTFNARVRLLFKVPAVVRWISAEPLLGEINAEEAFAHYDRNGEPSIPRVDPDGSLTIKWVVVGGESGSRARPMHPDWARKIRDQCVEAGCAFFFKQWGAWLPSLQFTPELLEQTPPFSDRWSNAVLRGDEWVYELADADCNGDDSWCCNVGKKRAGRVLYGRTWDEYPDA